MKHYLSPTGALYAYEPDGSQDEYIPADFVPATLEQVQAIQNPPVVPSIPTSLTMAQARIALLDAGLLDTVEAGIAQMPRAAQIKWEFAATVERADSLTQALAAALGLTEPQLDALFVAGAAL